MTNEKKHKRLTIDELRTFPGFEKYTDEQAEATIKTLETLSILFYELYMKKKYSERKLNMIKNENYETEQRIAA
jgi:hypothetical protein